MQIDTSDICISIYNRMHVLYFLKEKCPFYATYFQNVINKSRHDLKIFKFEIDWKHTWGGGTHAFYGLKMQRV